ncbi:MAG: DUF1302 family protein [Sinimarinibacterium sp.]|jgi:hypothetical protein
MRARRQCSTTAKQCRIAFALVVLAAFGPASAAAAQPESAATWTWSLRHNLSAGAAWRTAARDASLIGKSSLDPDLCAADDCLGTTATDTDPNARFLGARGSLSSNTDDGDLNFERGDAVSATTKWTLEALAERGPWSVGLSGLAFYDPLKERLRQFHPNQIVAPGPQPGVPLRSRRGLEARRADGHGVRLREAYVRYAGLVAGGVPLEVGLGRQTLLWGVSALATQGTLNVVNPPEVNSLVRPGARLTEVLQPLGMALLRVGPFPSGTSLEAFYPTEWQPYGFPAKGSLQSFFDAGNEVDADDHVVGLFSKAPDDPQQLGTPANALLARVSASSYSLRRAANREPRRGGEVGIALYQDLPDLLDGAELALHYAHYHSRLPVLSAYAASASCTRREGNANHRDTASGLQFLSDCGVPFVDAPGVDFEALPIDAARWFLEYPGNVDLYGLSLGAQAGAWMLQAEAAWRPDQPVQVDLEDVLFAAVQPAFPRADVDLSSLVPGLGLGALVLPSSRRAAPDFLTAYRGGNPGEIAPGAYVRGYERLRTLHATLGATRLFAPDEWLYADQGAWIAELQAVWLPGLPDRQRLQFEGPGTHTHASAGVADDGDALHINPQRNADGYVTRQAWGYRTGMVLFYDDVWRSRLRLSPALFLIHDVAGVGPGLAENFLEARKIGFATLGIARGAWRLDLSQLVHVGGGRRNVLRDRDQFSLSLSVEF